LNDQILLRVAVIFTFAGAGGSVWAIYIPSAEMVPEVAFPPKMPFTLQVRRGVAGSRHSGSQLQSFPQQDVSAWRRYRYGHGWRRWGGEPELAPPPPQPGKIAKAAINPNSKPLA